MVFRDKNSQFIPFVHKGLDPSRRLNKVKLRSHLE